MDKRFFQLVFTPFFSSAMGGDDVKLDQNIKVMVKRLKDMPENLRNELLLGLAREVEETARKLPTLKPDIKLAFKAKIEAIKALLDEF